MFEQKDRDVPISGRVLRKLRVFELNRVDLPFKDDPMECLFEIPVFKNADRVWLE